jgi:hypothetical protein
MATPDTRPSKGPTTRSGHHPPSAPVITMVAQNTMAT